MLAHAAEQILDIGAICSPRYQWKDCIIDGHPNHWIGGAAVTSKQAARRPSANGHLHPGCTMCT